MILCQTFGWFRQSCQNNRGWITERELGDDFEVDDVVLRVVEASNMFSCDGCYFLECDRTACEFQNCLRCERKDRKSVKFVKVYG